MLSERLILVSAVDAAYWFMREYQVMIKPGLIRLWAHRGKVSHHGGKKPFDLRELEEYARKRGLLA